MQNPTQECQSFHCSLWQGDSYLSGGRMRLRVRLGKAFFLAVAFNLVLFSLPALLGTLQQQITDTWPEKPISFIRIKPERTPPPEKIKKKIEEKKTEIKKPKLKKPEPVLQKPKITPPELLFDINPRLQMGMQVAAPPAEKIIRPLQTEFEMGAVDVIPMVTMRLKPVYPFRAKRMRITGKVDIRFLVDNNGSVSNIQVIEAAPPNIFDESVRKAVSRWRFQPGKKEGRAVNTWMTTTIHFELE